MIPDGRLEAIPWTPWCAECAAREEKESGTAPREMESPGQNLDMDVKRMGDEALKAAILDRLRSDGRVEMEELGISVDRGRVMIKGSLPSETKHQMLLQFLTDTLGIRDIADRVSIDRQLWERHDRSPGQGEESGKSEAEVIMQGEEEKEETNEAMAEGTSTLPSDRFIPEKEE